MDGDQSEERAGRLKELARARFHTLSAAELKLMRAAPQAEGGVAYCGPSHHDDDPENDPSNAQKWGPERQIRAELIRWLCVEQRARDFVDPVGIQIHAAKIVGELSLSHIAVPFPLHLRRCALTDDCRFFGTRIPRLDFSGSWTRSIYADGINVTENLELRHGFRAEGEVSLVNAQIGGNVECDGGTFMNPPGKAPSRSGIALGADGITVRGGVFLSEGFRANGTVRLVAAQIGNNLECRDGTFTNPPGKEPSRSGTALIAEGIIVRGQVLLIAGFRAEGKVSLLNAQIGGNLECEGGTFINPLVQVVAESGTALTADRAKVGGSVVFTNGFRAEGIVRLPFVHIGGDLETLGGTFTAAVFSLEYASAGTIVDDERSWPKRGNLFLNGFIYEQISPPGYVRSAVLSPQDVETRLKWLNLQPERPFNPQPYLQLAKVLRGIGNYAGATTVLEEMERRRRHLEDHTPTDRIASWVFRESIGYGHDPLRAIWMILGLSVIGWVLYRRGYLAGNMVPSDEEAYESFKSEGRPPRHYRAFAPLVYSLENSLPLVKLGLADQWQPDPSSKDQLSRKRNWIATFRDQLTWPRQLSWVHRLLVFCGLQPHANLENPPSRFSRFATSPRFLRWFLWIQILLGWLLATLFLAGVTGIVRSQ